MSLVLGFVAEPVGVFVLAAGVVALVGALFEISERWLVRLGIAWLPGVVSAPLVAGLVAAVVAGSVWILGSTTATVLDTRTQQAIAEVLNDIPPGSLGWDARWRPERHGARTLRVSSRRRYLSDAPQRWLKKLIFLY